MGKVWMFEEVEGKHIKDKNRTFVTALGVLAIIGEYSSNPLDPIKKVYK